MKQNPDMTASFCTLDSSSQWNGSKSSLISSSTLTDSRRLVSDHSMVSSGFWEDCESLTRSGFENVNNWNGVHLAELHADWTPEINGNAEKSDGLRKHSQDSALSNDQSSSRSWSPSKEWSSLHLEKSSRVCSSEDSSDSDEDLEWLENLGQPKTRFEAALRKARLADRKRRLLSSGKQSNLTGRTFPTWDSPIKSHSLQQFDDIPYQIEPLPYKPNKESKFPIRPDSPGIPRGKDLCTGIEAWLDTRPRNLYEPEEITTHALQLCFISLSEQNLLNPTVSPMETLTVSPIDLDFVNGDCPTEDTTDGSQLTDAFASEHASMEVNSVCSQTGVKRIQTLLRDHGENEDLWRRINDLDRYCGLYLEQLLEECREENMEIALTKRLEQHHRLHVASELALSQLPKVAQMQAEVEQYTWSIPSAPVAKLLQLSPKPRTTMDESQLDRFSSYQLQLIVNDLHSSIHNLNEDLLQELAERDDLHSELGRKSVQVGRLAEHFKDLCVRTSVRQFRRRLSNPTGQVSADQIIVHVTPDNRSSGPLHGATRLVRNLFGRKSNRF